MPTLLRKPSTYLNSPLRVMDMLRARTYFSGYDEEDLFNVRRYWQTYATRKQLIDFGTRRSKIKYFYDSETKKYYRQLLGGRKRVVPAHYIKLDINRFANQMCQLQREWAEALLHERIDVQDWYTGALGTMKYSYRAVVDIARGRSTPMSVDEEREFLRLMEEETSKLNYYARQLADGEIPLNGHHLNAACSLGKKLNRVFENWKLWDAKQSGFVQARRRLTVAEHCRDSEQRYGCVELARRGWQSIETITPIGGATCWDGCLCEMEYR